MEEERNVYMIPVNYTDSGKLFGGMLSVRSAIETVILLLVFGCIELALIPMGETLRIIVMVVTLLPLGIFAMMGIDGESLFQYIGHICKYIFKRRKIHFRKVTDGQEK